MPMNRNKEIMEVTDPSRQDYDVWYFRYARYDGGGMRPAPQQMFNRLDKDGGSSIDKDELSAMAEKMAEEIGTEMDDRRDHLIRGIKG